jgi:hypothetical protein
VGFWEKGMCGCSTVKFLSFPVQGQEKKRAESEVEFGEFEGEGMSCEGRTGRRWGETEGEGVGGKEAQFFSLVTRANTL